MWFFLGDYETNTTSFSSYISVSLGFIIKSFDKFSIKMAFEILSLTRVEREFDDQPNYKVVILYRKTKISCEIKTNALFLNEGNIICDHSFRNSLGRNFFLQLETSNPWHREYEKNLENELINFAKNQNKDLKMLKTINGYDL